MGSVIGVLGGMGPMATVDLIQKIIENTSAQKDQDHYQMIVYNNPKIPSRVGAILDNKESPLPELIKSARLVEAAGASFIIIPCHTAHYWYNEIVAAINIPIYNLIEITAKYVVDTFDLNNDKLLIFATPATIATSLYQQQFRKYNYEIIVPTYEEQRVVTEVINQIKAGKLENNPELAAINQIINRYKQQGVSLLLAGCTEISILLPYISGDVHKLNPLQIIAEYIVKVVEIY
jgi:aspartate racemase